MSDFKQYVNFYQFETVLPGSGKMITFKPITTGQIKRLLLYETSDDPNSIENSLDDVITECVVDEDFSIDDLYLQDRFYLLLDMRKATKGNTYSFSSKCTKCESQSSQSIKLTDLPVKTLNIPKEDVVRIKKQKSINMKKGGKLIDSDEVVEEKPKTSNWNLVNLNDKLAVKLLHTTRGGQKQVEEIMKSNAELTDLQKSVEETTLLYAMSIKSVVTPDGEDDNLTMNDKVYIIENIPQNEHMLISKWFEDNDFGVDFSFDVECAHCQYKEKKSIPLDNFFF